MVIIALMFMAIDFFCFAALQQWIVQTLFIYVIILALAPDFEKKKTLFLGASTLLIIQDFALYGRVGAIVAFLVPLYFLIKMLKDTLLQAHFMLMTISIISFCLYQSMLLNYLIYGVSTPFSVTSVKIFTNLILGFVIHRGVLGNRSRNAHVSRGRKVWTPNRMDASQDA